MTNFTQSDWSKKQDTRCRDDVARHHDVTYDMTPRVTCKHGRACARNEKLRGQQCWTRAL